MPPATRGNASAAGELNHGYSAFTNLRTRTNAGEEMSFDVFEDKVVLVVNVARL